MQALKEEVSVKYGDQPFIAEALKNFPTHLANETVTAVSEIEKSGD
jgi:hypothetical protein